jgi:uncharacterized protein (DUF1778 family)
MANVKPEKKRVVKIEKSERVCTQFRFLNEEHYDLVRQAASLAGLSMNSWLVHATLREARSQLKRKA